MSQIHPYQWLQVPSDAPFELKPSSPGKGWGAFATRRISRGSDIFTEKPLFVIHKPHTQITDADVWAAFQQLGVMEKMQFLCLRDNGSRPFGRMDAAFAENSFSPDKNSEKYGLFLLLSRFNHSCLPNSKIPKTDQEAITNVATQDIDVGQEITFCYNPGFECRFRHERHQELRFKCDCKACRVGTPFQQLSDMRRILLRGLHYLWYGVDLNGQTTASSFPGIISDPQLKRAAEKFQIPLSARLVHVLLMLVLLEEEGLLDDFLTEELSQRVLALCDCFLTVENIRIARLVSAQETWVDKFCMASTFYWRSDDNDIVISEVLQYSV